MPLKAVLFDLDGTLAETEARGYEIARAIFDEVGIELTEEDHRAFRGRAEDAFFFEMGRRYGLPDVAPVREAFTARYLPTLEQVEPLGGAVEAVRAAGNLAPVGIVSGSTNRQIDAVLSALGLTEDVDLRVGCDDYQKSKPDAEPYLLAADRFEVTPRHCLVIEDSDPGVLSARAAGMRCIRVRATGKAGGQVERPIPEADRVVSSLAEVDLQAIAETLFG